MKRSPLLRHAPLTRRARLRSRPKPVKRTDPARIAWKTTRAGRCDCCTGFTMHLHHHHVYPERLVHMEGGDVWAPANGMFVCERCHMNHHSAFRRIPLCKVPAAAQDFAVRLVGEDRALLFFARFYGHPRGEELL